MISSLRSPQTKPVPMCGNRVPNSKSFLKMGGNGVGTKFNRCGFFLLTVGSGECGCVRMHVFIEEEKVEGEIAGQVLCDFQNN